jgi:hypothetical protein
MIRLGHARLDQRAQLACALSPHYLLVDINLELRVWKFFCAPAVPMAASVSPMSISSSVLSSLVVPPIRTCVAAPDSPTFPIPLPLPLPLPLLPVPLKLFLSRSRSLSRSSSLALCPRNGLTARPHCLPPASLVCVSVSIASISSLLVCRLAPCALRYVPSFQDPALCPRSPQDWLRFLTRCCAQWTTPAGPALPS